MKFHINANGDAGQCRAVKGACPFGGEAAHYATAEEARTAYEVTQQALANMEAEIKDSLRPVPVPENELMSVDQQAHRVGKYFVSTRRVGSIGAKPGQIDTLYETVIIDEENEEGLPVFEDATRDPSLQNAAHREAIRLAQRKMADSMQTVSFTPKVKSSEVVGTVGADGFVASTYPSHGDYVPEPVRAVVEDAGAGKTGFVAVRPHHGGGYLTHVMRDNPAWRQSMGLGKLIMYGRPICKSSSTRSAPTRIDGGHNDPTPPSEALANNDNVCEGCASKYADPDFK